MTRQYHDEIELSATRLVSAELHNLTTKVTIPVQLDPTFKWETTQLINRVVALWGEIPAAFLLECNPRKHTYAYIGLEDRTMYPLLKPGALLMIDGDRREVTATDGTTNTNVQSMLWNYVMAISAAGATSTHRKSRSFRIQSPKYLPERSV